MGFAARAFLGVALGGILVHGIGAAGLGGASIDRAVADWLYCGLFAAAAASCAYRAARERRAGGNVLAWTIAAVGVAVWCAAEVCFRLLEPDPTAPYPLATQGMLLVAFTLATTTLVLLSRDRIEGFNRGLALDGLIGGLAVAAVAASLLFPVGGAEAAGGSQQAPPAFFLLFDLAILAFVVVTIALTGWRPGACWGLICAGIVLNTAGNIALVQASEAGAFERGSYVDTLYLASALMLGLATWFPIRPSVRRSADDVRSVVAPLLLGSLALALLLFAAFEAVSAAAILLATGALALIVARTALAFRDNRRLLEARERDSLTDGLTGLGNRRQLMSDLREALERARAGGAQALMLFDLDGFKGYNDAFGHPAGDSLLARLGASLAASIAPHGRAYRMGGDEFCAIVETDGLKLEAIVAGACEALSESGSGFSVRPSCGVAVLGSEAATVAQALQLADQRMYREKSGRRGSVELEARELLLGVLRESEPGLDRHQHEVARLACQVGEELGLENEELDVLARAAELHDIGKMATPDAILHKAGPLDEREWEIMRRHTVVGERILSSAAALRPVAAVVRSTHERIDGGGYPDGLSGDRIPLGARVIAVCDAYHAMRSERPYDRVLDHAEALAELRRCAGSQFDPEIVELFCRIVEKDRSEAGPADEALGAASRAGAGRPPSNGERPGAAALRGSALSR